MARDHRAAYRERRAKAQQAGTTVYGLRTGDQRKRLLAQLAKARMRSKLAALEQALTGRLDRFRDVAPLDNDAHHAV